MQNEVILTDGEKFFSVNLFVQQVAGELAHKCEYYTRWAIAVVDGKKVGYLEVRAGRFTERAPPVKRVINILMWIKDGPTNDCDIHICQDDSANLIQGELEKAVSSVLFKRERV